MEARLPDDKWLKTRALLLVFTRKQKVTLRASISHRCTVVPAFNGHFCIQAKVSLHGRCPLIGGTGMFNKI